MSIIRAPRPRMHFTMLRNSVLRDETLSYRARGVLAAILSRPDNWRTDADSLARQGKEGRDAIRTALRELEDAGYLVRFKEQDPATGQWRTHCHVYDRPVETTEDGNPVVGNPGVGEPDNGNPVAIRKTDTKKREEEFPSAVAEGTLTARDIAGRWVDVFREVHGTEPPQVSVKRIAQAGKQLLSEGFSPDLLLSAASDCASGGHANLASSVTYLSAKGSRQPKGFDGIREFLDQ